MPGSLESASRFASVLVVDSWPVMEWFKEREPTATRFEKLIESARNGEFLLIMSTINVGEIYYSCWNKWNESRADESLAVLQRLPIQVFHPTEQDVMTAARIKATYKIAYADAFAAVLAADFGQPVVTGDPDFLKLQQSGVLSVDWWGE